MVLRFYNFNDILIKIIKEVAKREDYMKGWSIFKILFGWL